MKYQTTKSKNRMQLKLPKCVRPEEFKALIKATPKKDIIARIAFLLAYGSGMRVSEVARCSKEHFRERSIFIPESKYGVERVVPIPKGWKKDFLKQLPLDRSIRSLQRRFTIYKKKSKINQDCTFHSLRHGFATRAIEKGMPLNHLQIVLGHANLSTTSIYVKANPKDMLDSYEELF